MKYIKCPKCGRPLIPCNDNEYIICKGEPLKNFDKTVWCSGCVRKIKYRVEKKPQE